MTKSLTDLQQEIQSDDWEAARSAADALADYGAVALPVLLPLLRSESAHTRSAVALALRAIADDTAVEPLVQAIRDPLPAGRRGTLVYALETHDCSAYFPFLFELVLSDTFEVQNHALTLLHEQQFWYDMSDLEIAQAQLEAYIRRQDRAAGTDVLIAELQALLADLRHHAQR